MYLITYSTPETIGTVQINTTLTHKALVKRCASRYDGAGVYYLGVNGKPRYIGYFANGELIKP
jgi:hypothetical protein